MPDSARADAERKPKPAVTASTTGIHHPTQPSVWAHDSTSNPSSPAQHSGWQPSTSASAFSQRDEPWPSWAQMEDEAQLPPSGN